MLDIIGAYKKFGGNTALDGVNLHLDEGEFVTVIGSNGAGKSTLLGAIAGSVILDGGEIMLDGRDITAEKEYRRAKRIGRLFQDPRLGTAPDLTIEENMALVYSKTEGRFPLARALRPVERQLFFEVLKNLDMDMEKRLKTPVSTLSGGQRQALTLILATLSPPGLLLLDEHTAALDPIAAKKVLALTEDITQKHRTTTLMITHNIKSALETGSRTIMMHGGSIVLDIRGGERKNMSVEDMLRLYRDTVHETLDTDKIIFGE
jgi:putative ABC transport system ATP-binding protein